MIKIEVGNAKTNHDTKITADGEVLGFIRKIILDMNGSYAEVEMYDLNEKSEECARTLVKHGFIVNRIDPRQQ